MAYTKTDWACGDKITAEKLNKIEQGIVDAQNGYECTESWTTLTEETVTTAYDSEMEANTGTLAYSQFIDVDKLKITFNGTEYELERRDTGNTELINYFNDNAPCGIETRNMLGTISNTLIVLNEAGTYTIKIEVPSEVVNTTECFEKAVESVVGGASGALIVKYDHDSDGQQYYDKTWQQVKDAFDAGLPIYLHLEGVSSDTRQYFDHLSFKSGSLAVTFDDFSGGNTQLLAENVNGFLYKSSIS